MLAQLVSDLHTEMRDEVLPLLPGWRDPKADLLIIAGDACNWASRPQLRALRAAVAGWDAVLYVPGNHEYYEGSPLPATTQAAEEFLGSNIHTAFHPGFFDLCGQVFYAGTMWYRRSDVEKLPGAVPDQGRWHQRSRGVYRTFNDFRFVKNLSPFCYDHNRLFLEGLTKVEPHHVVVSHHLPSSLSTPPEFRHEIDNCFFCCDAEPEIKGLRPQAWLHGHTHTPCDYSLGGTRVIANPLGYRHERKVDRYVPATLEF